MRFIETFGKTQNVIQNVVKPVSYGSYPSTSLSNFFKYFSLASLNCRMSKYLDKNISGRLHPKVFYRRFLFSLCLLLLSFLVGPVKTTRGCTPVHA